MGTKARVSPNGSKPTGLPGWGAWPGGLRQRGKRATASKLVPRPALRVEYGGTCKTPSCEVPSNLKWFVLCFARFHACFPIFWAKFLLIIFLLPLLISLWLCYSWQA